MSVKPSPHHDTEQATDLRHLDRRAIVFVLTKGGGTLNDISEVDMLLDANGHSVYTRHG